MQKKEIRAIGREEARAILGDLANVSLFERERTVAAKKFVQKHGPLRRSSKRQVAEVIYVSALFRKAWSARSEHEIALVNAFLDDIFTLSGDAFFGEGPVITADFGTGEWRPQPKELIEVLAIELMKSRKMLARCEYSECARYFIRSHPRDRYCRTRFRPTCGEVMRGKSVTKYQQTHREELNAKRRKPRNRPR